MLSATLTIGKQEGNFSSLCKHSNDVLSSKRPEHCMKQNKIKIRIHKQTVLLVDENDTKAGFCKMLAHNWVGHFLSQFFCWKHNFANTRYKKCSIAMGGKPLSASFLLEPFSTEVQTWKTPTKGGFRDLWTFESPEAMITICLREEMRLKACAAFNPGFVLFNPFLARQQIVGYNKKYPVTYVTVVHTL